MSRRIPLAALLVCLVPATAPAAAPAPALGRQAMVVTSQADATRAGVDILRAGGNAVDAAVAVAFALNVTQPNSTGIGGGAFVLIRRSDGETVAIDCRETAPAAATRDTFTREGVPEDASFRGPLASGTPGIVAGLALAARRYGTMPLAELLAPAIRLAEEGYVIGPYQAGLMRALQERGWPGRHPDVAAIHFPPDGAPARRGLRLVQKDLARTLRAIAAKGPEVFYTGEIGEAIAREMERSGGLLTAEDLAGYRPVLREPVRGTYRGHEILSFPPPSSGGIAIVQMLNILEGFDLAELGAGSSATLHRLAEAMKLAFADRNTWVGDPDFVDVPVAGLTSKAYAAELRARINPPRWRRAPWTWARDEVATGVEVPGAPPPGGGTTHLSVVDAEGNAVALTQTYNWPYGSWVLVPGTGIILNNEMDDFATDPDAPNAWGLVDTRGANAIEPGKRPLSSMAPTLVLRDGEVFLVTGSPNGPRIITATLQTILNVIDHGLDVQAAVSRPRIHHQWIPDTLYVESAVPADVVDALRDRGHDVETQDFPSATESVLVDAETGHRLGGADPRRDGLALGF